MSESIDINKIFELGNPKEYVSLYEAIASNVSRYIRVIREDFSERITVKGRGFPPVAVTLGGLMSIGGFLVSASAFSDHLKYVMTSPEVAEGRGFFALSNKYFNYAVKEMGLEPIVVKFDEIPEYGAAEKLLSVLKEGAMIVQGVSAELAIWLGRNAGVGRLMIYRPNNGVAVFRYV